MHEISSNFSCFTFISPKFARIFKYFAQSCNYMIAAFRNSDYCMCRGVPGGVILSVNIVCAGVFLGVSFQVSLLYMQGCSLRCHVKCYFCMCRGVP